MRIRLTTQRIVDYAVRFRKPLIGCGILLGLFLLFNYLLLPIYVNHGSRLPVPQVIGQPLDGARRMLDSASLEAVESDTRPDPVYPAGTVVYQNPAAGAIVKEGRRVYLTVSGGEVLVVVPQLRGRTLRDARFALERFGLKLGGVAHEYSDSYPENTIIAQAIPADTKLPKGSEVSLTVSHGRLLDSVTVPTVVGKPLTEAEKELARAGLRVGNVTYQQSFDLLPNTVVDQFPRGDESVRPGQAVDLFVVETGRPVEEVRPPGR
jgi:serine/threonine-protein kinase